MENGKWKTYLIENGKWKIKAFWGMFIFNF